MTDARGLASHSLGPDSGAAEQESRPEVYGESERVSMTELPPSSYMELADDARTLVTGALR